MTRTSKNIIAVMMLSILIAGVSGCKKESPMERTGKEINKAAEKTADNIKKAGDKFKDSLK